MSGRKVSDSWQEHISRVQSGKVVAHMSPVAGREAEKRGQRESDIHVGAPLIDSVRRQKDEPSKIWGFDAATKPLTSNMVLFLTESGTKYCKPR